MIVASTIVPPAFAGAGFAASAGRAPPASRRLPRTAPGSDRAIPTNAGNARPSRHPAPGRGSTRSRQSRAALGYRRRHPRPLHRPTRTTAAQNRPAAYVPAGSAADRARLSDRAGRGVPPAGATALPAPSRLEIYRAASASFCRRTPPRQNSPDAASICLRHNTGQILPNPGPETGLFQRILRLTLFHNDVDWSAVQQLEIPVSNRDTSPVTLTIQVDGTTSDGAVKSRTGVARLRPRESVV